MPLTFDNRARSETLDAFVLLVTLNAARIDYSRIMSSGEDLRFVDADTRTALPHEIENWNGSGDSHVWVKVPRIDAQSDADHIWLYFDCANSAPQNPATLWEPAHAGVWHFHDDLNDSTTFAQHGADNGSTPAAGIIGGGREFDGAGAQVDRRGQ